MTFYNCCHKQKIKQKQHLISLFTNASDETQRIKGQTTKQPNQIRGKKFVFYHYKTFCWNVEKKVIEKKGSKEFSVPFIASEYTVKQTKNALALIRVTNELEYKSDLLSTLLYTI